VSACKDGVLGILCCVLLCPISLSLAPETGKVCNYVRNY
jgi:hypothetical protein